MLEYIPDTQEEQLGEPADCQCRTVSIDSFAFDIGNIGLS